MFAGTVLVVATLLAGLVAGVFALYAHTIMPALRRTDDRTFVAAFQAIDRAIINPWFMACFFGALILTGLAGALHLRPGGDQVVPWIAAAFVLYLLAVVITGVVNVPRNDAIKAAGDPDQIDLAAARRNFGEASWAAWNLVRVGLSLSAFGCLLIALAR